MREEKGGGRRHFLRQSVCAISIALCAPALAQTVRPWRMGLTPVFLDDQISFLAQWRQWLTEQLERPLVFVQRGNYREIVDLLLAGKLDFAWLCGYPYLRYRRQLQLVAVPLWQGRPYYRSYLIVPHDSPARELRDLRGAVFAYADPDSNSGFLYPQYALSQRGENPATFFARTFFTWAHRNVVEAVGAELAQGGAVDGYVWEMLMRTRPYPTSLTRVIERSPWFGFPPIVARQDLARIHIVRFCQILSNMANDAQGAALLASLGLDGFVTATPELYDGIVKMMERLRR
ncbi:MAG: PhnD/SsuA/transferrin family substrate-binding protein [Rhodocyclaceae bacterium]|nr:PhnD/SsuA/transferrin family substrate-binding protein [Rhodocyclaceae bacterium]